MSYKFDATNDYFSSQKKVTILIKFAQREANKENETNRRLFLSLGIVQLVTNFQVFVESILKEFEFAVKTSNKKNKKLPIFLRLKSLNIIVQNANINENLKNPTLYSIHKLNETKNIISLIHEFCEDEQTISDNFKIDTKYPLGKQGLNELKALLSQIEGIDIFINSPFDINKLNEILNRRHAIIHENSNMQLTEPKVKEYRDFMSIVVRFISNYLKGMLLK